MEVVGHRLLQLLVEVLRAADETDGRHAVTAGVHRLLGGFDEARAVGQAEVVVGAEIQRLAAVLECNLGALGGADIAFVLVQAGLFDGGFRSLFSPEGSFVFR